MKNMKYLLAMLAIFVGFITGCAQNVSPNTYDASEIGKASKVERGVIVSRRVVSIDANSGAGGVAGVAGGAAAGSMIGGSGATNLMGAVGGAVLGGLAGNQLDKAINNHRGLEYIIKLKGGKTISVVQAEDMKFAVNQRVLVIYGSKTRLIPDTM